MNNKNDMSLSVVTILNFVAMGFAAFCFAIMVVAMFYFIF